MDVRSLLEMPDAVFVVRPGPNGTRRATRTGDYWAVDGLLVSVRVGDTRTSVSLLAGGELNHVALRWKLTFPGTALFLGDHWERGYGDLQWRHRQPERVMPWYFGVHDPASTLSCAAGVGVRPSALCFWTVDEDGVTLWLDCRNGGEASIPGDRVLPAAEIVVAAPTADLTPEQILRALCEQMCSDPRLPLSPVCGGNNWYYAYGVNFDEHQVLRDAEFVGELAGDHVNRPYSVIDAGWSEGGVCPGGPWDAGHPTRFPDMPGLAKRIREHRAIPGIWLRPTALTRVNDPSRLRTGPQTQHEKALDLTLDGNLEIIRREIINVRSWGYELIKHDFSTFDAFGKWGFEMGAEITARGWTWHDRSLTNAEVLLRLYRTLRAAADAQISGCPQALLLGCNTIGHLGAGLFELQRTGDDTSGRVWERTRRMGINTLAFRMPQHGTFFVADADCVASTDQTPWEKDRQWLDLVARSGTALFVSADPRTASREVKEAMSKAMRIALGGGAKRACALDWIHTTTPDHWSFDGEQVTYDWSEPPGASPFTC